MPAEHIMKRYDEELDRLNKMIVEMGGLAESQLAAAIDAVIRRDSDLAAEVVEGDVKVDQIEQDLDKIRRWFDHVKDRDWFKAERRSEVEAWLERCQDLLSRFEEEVYRRQAADTESAASTSDEAPSEDRPPQLRPLAPLRPVHGRGRRAGARASSLRPLSEQQEA